ncbi:hypothetical protein B0H11DRAFT_1716153, partial [Mycena galericulata]
PDDGGKPHLSYSMLSKLAVYGSRTKKLTGSRICDALVERFQWFQANDGDEKWKVVSDPYLFIRR